MTLTLTHRYFVLRGSLLEFAESIVSTFFHLFATIVRGGWGTTTAHDKRGEQGNCGPEENR